MNHFFFLLRYASEEFSIFQFVIIYNLYTQNKRMCLCVCFYEKTAPCRTIKFHMKIVIHVNVCNWDLDFQFFFVFILLIKNNN